LYATTEIANGDEIFVSYGSRYWSSYPLRVETVLVEPKTEAG
jgi:hypothetical protein